MTFSGRIIKGEIQTNDVETFFMIERPEVEVYHVKIEVYHVKEILAYLRVNMGTLQMEYHKQIADTVVSV